MKSVGAKVKQLAGLLGTRDVTEWEDGFIQSIVARTNEGEDTSRLSGPQLDTIERMWSKHFAG